MLQAKQWDVRLQVGLRGGLDFEAVDWRAIIHSGSPLQPLCILFWSAAVAMHCGTWQQA